MISLATAQKLKAAGLKWVPQVNHFFAIPDRGLDDRIFVISEMTVYIEILRGRPAMVFNGAVEWALDYVMLPELVWMPTEGQLREELERRLAGDEPPLLKLLSTEDGYQCEIKHDRDWVPFESFGASEAYASALLYVLEQPGARR